MSRNKEHGYNVFNLYCIFEMILFTIFKTDYNIENSNCCVVIKYNKSIFYTMGISYK